MSEPAELPAARPADAGSVKGEARVEEPTRPQAQHARRVAESRATVPDISLTTQVDMEAAAALRAAAPAPGLSFEDLVVKACGVALREAPRANGAYRDARFEHYPRVNVAESEQIVAAMKAEGARRILAISAGGVGDSHEKVPAFFRAFIVTTSLRKVYPELERMEEVLFASGLDVCIARPTGLTDGPVTGAVKVVERMAGRATISRASLIWRRPTLTSC